jgi:dihydrofolate synthase/folylpolyglutamate synthase
MADQVPEAEQTILHRAQELASPIFKASDHEIDLIELTPYGSTFHFLGERFTCGLPGVHQVQNAATAILACLEFGLPRDAIHKGIASARWPGRMEYVARRPDFILDGAHNPAGARILATYIQQFCSNRPVWLVYGAMRDKAIEEVAGQLFPLASKLILTAPNSPRALRPAAILEIARHPNAATTANVPAAIELARQAPPEAAVFFTGSLFLVGEARAILVPATN